LSPSCVQHPGKGQVCRRIWFHPGAGIEVVAGPGHVDQRGEGVLP
jgi:hypothetical protein